MLSRQLEAQLRALSTRAFTTSSIVFSAAPAVASAVKPKGLLAQLFGGGNRVQVPLTDPLPGVEIVETVALPTSPPKTETTTLANGCRIASENTPVRLSILVNACL